MARTKATSRKAPTKRKVITTNIINDQDIEEEEKRKKQKLEKEEEEKKNKFSQIKHDLNFERLLQDKNSFDFKFYINDSQGQFEFGCHKIILNLYIKELIQDLNEIELNCPKEVFLKVIHYFYSGGIELIYSELEELIILCELLKLNELRKDCIKYLFKSLNLDNIKDILFKIIKNEFKFSSQGLLENTIDFISINAPDILNQEWFFELPRELIELILKSDQLFFDEIQLFLKLIEWGNKRKEDVNDLMKFIRFSLISSQDLIKIVKPTQLCPQDIYVKSLEYLCNPNSEKYLTPIDISRGLSFKNSTLLNVDQMRLLSSWIGHSKKFKLIYKATRDGFSSNSFHLKCDKKGETISIIQVGKQYLFGGYNPKNWSSNSNDHKSHPNTFIFSLLNTSNTGPTKMIHTNGGINSIYNDPNVSMVFGEDHDLYIEEQNNCCDISTFQLPPNVSSTDYLAGTQNFTPTEIEVFSLDE